jgi:hypothetical protein
MKVGAAVSKCQSRVQLQLERRHGREHCFVGRQLGTGPDQVFDISSILHHVQMVCYESQREIVVTRAVAPLTSENVF